MKKWYRYLAAGVLVLLTLCVAGCGGVSHKSPEKVTEELIQSYTDGKEKKVKECYNQADIQKQIFRQRLQQHSNILRHIILRKYLFRIVRSFLKMTSTVMYT